MTDNNTQAAANKAAEEGGLLHEVKEFLGDMHAMPVEWTIAQSQVLCAKVSGAITADRTSRQVANKAVQEARAAYKDRPTYDDNVSIGSRDFFEMLIEYGKEPSLSKRMEIADFIDSHIDKLVANKAEVEPVAEDVRNAVHSLIGPGFHIGLAGLDIASIISKLATPPATTSASTVLTDERIEAIYQKGYDDFAGPRQFRHAANRNVYHRAGLREVAREVAAQAGQVAGWMNPANGEVTSAANKKQMESAEFGQWKEIATRYTVPLLAPSPAKESK